VIGYALALSVPGSAFAELREQVRRLVAGDSVAGPWEAADVVVAIDDPDEDTREYLTRVLHAEPTADMWLAVDDTRDEADFAAAERRALSLAVRIAVECDAIACLTFETGGVMMRRSGGVVQLNSSWSQWSDPELLDRLPPFVVTDEPEAL
jgi:hypothetical protein